MSTPTEPIEQMNDGWREVALSPRDWLGAAMVNHQSTLLLLEHEKERLQNLVEFARSLDLALGSSVCVPALPSSSLPNAMMLAGLAVENYLKGLLVSRERESLRSHAENNDSLPRWITRHSLRDLLSRTGISVAEAEKKLLDRLEDAVTWKGRYPLPKRSKDLLVNGAPPPFWNFSTSNDPLSIRDLLEKLRTKVCSELGVEVANE